MAGVLYSPESFQALQAVQLSVVVSHDIVTNAIKFYADRITEPFLTGHFRSISALATEDQVQPEGRGYHDKYIGQNLPLPSPCKIDRARVFNFEQFQVYQKADSTQINIHFVGGDSEYLVFPGRFPKILNPDGHLLVELCEETRSPGAPEAPKPLHALVYGLDQTVPIAEFPRQPPRDDNISIYVGSQPSGARLAQALMHTLLGS
ncbi:MAG: hypothetical protein Q9162_000361 [Coniocarpon cinnabarinum]